MEGKVLIVWRECTLKARRYGPGIYSKLSSQAADRYATSCTTSPFRVSVICLVTISDELGGPTENTRIVRSSAESMWEH